MTNHVPAQLIIGSGQQLTAHVELTMQKQFCPTFNDEQGCFCSECRKIKNRQHSLMVWLSPEKDYSVDDIEIIFERTRFALDPDQKFYFILDNAHTLTTTTANRLLKVLEEPPAGYNFLLLTSNPDDILPTIQSRCMVVELASAQPRSSKESDHPLLQYFVVPEKRNDPFGFELELKKQTLTESVSMDLLSRLISFYIQKMKNVSDSDQAQQEKISVTMNFLTAAMRKPPQPGSGETFWKFLFLRFPK